MIPDKIDINRLGENITLDSTEDKIGTECKRIEPDFSKMFQTCSCVSEIKDGNVIFTDGTSMPLSQILQTDPSIVNNTPNIGVPMHDPPFPAPKPDIQKPSYVQIDEKLELYKKIFLIVLPIILRRESHPFNYKMIMEQANDVTVNTMRQFSKMREYYSEHI